MGSFNEQLARMQGLMNYGVVTESENKPAKSIEYHEIGADGKSYAIIKENANYFIKSAPADKEMVLESYDYIDGWNHIDKHEYSSYSTAKKQFGFKMASLKEAYNYNIDKDDVSSYANMELMTEGSEKMMNEIARQKQIMYNAAAILKEDSSICKCTKENPEAPKQAEGKPADSSEPFTETEKVFMDKEPKKAAGKPETTGAPYGEGEKAEEMKDAEYVPEGSVANQKPKGGKVAKVNEGIEDLQHDEISDEPVDDIDLGTDEIGDEEGPIEGGDDDIELGSEDDDIELDSDEDDIELDSDEDSELGSDDDIELDSDEEGEEESIESLKAQIASLEARISELEGDEDSEIEGEEGLGDDENIELDGEEDSEFGNEEDAELEGEDDIELDDEDSELEDAEEDDSIELDDDFSEEGDMEEEFDRDSFMESVVKEISGEILTESRKANYMNNIVESVVSKVLKEEKTELHDFGKHPGYRKKPMELPETGSDNFQGNRDWNDESVHNEQPFGQGKGKSDPYEDLVNSVTNEVMEAIKKKA